MIDLEVRFHRETGRYSIKFNDLQNYLDFFNGEYFEYFLLDNFNYMTSPIDFKFVPNDSNCTAIGYHAGFSVCNFVDFKISLEVLNTDQRCLNIEVEKDGFSVISKIFNIKKLCKISLLKDEEKDEEQDNE